MLPRLSLFLWKEITIYIVHCVVSEFLRLVFHQYACCIQAHLLDTMSFVDALPPFRMKQWQVIVLLFLDALSVCRIPGLPAYLTSRRILIPKVNFFSFIDM